MRLLVLFFVGIFSASLHAHEAGNWIGRLSLDLQTFSVDQEGATGNLTGVQDARLDDDLRVGYSLQYFVFDYLSLGLSTSWPFRHDLNSDSGKLADVRFFPVTVMAQYSLPKWNRLQPWLGVGYHHSFTRSERLKPAGSALSASSVRLDDLQGLALELGVDWDLRRHTTLGLRATRVEADATLHLRDAAGVDVGSLELNTEPLVWSLNLSRRW